LTASSNRHEYLSTLNPAQHEAATFGARRDGEVLSAGPLLVVAGAGTGKTMTLAHRVAHLVVEGVDTRRILLLTFTRRAGTVSRTSWSKESTPGGSCC
jgi:DNA helicase-2/ATP-dependent DNA helicase PcrA